MKTINNDRFFDYNEMLEILDCNNIDAITNEMKLYLPVKGFIEVIKIEPSNTTQQFNRLIENINNNEFWDIENLEYGNIDSLNNLDTNINLEKIFIDGLIQFHIEFIAPGLRIIELIQTQYCKFNHKSNWKLQEQTIYNTYVLSYKSFKNIIEKNRVIETNLPENFDKIQNYEHDLKKDLLYKYPPSGIIKYHFHEWDILSCAELYGIDVNKQKLNSNKKINQDSKTNVQSFKLEKTSDLTIEKTQPTTKLKNLKIINYALTELLGKYPQYQKNENLNVSKVADAIIGFYSDDSEKSFDGKIPSSKTISNNHSNIKKEIESLIKEAFNENHNNFSQK